MNVIVCGDRHWTDYQVIRDRLAQLPPGTGIVEGGQFGADDCAKTAALELRFAHRRYRANWLVHGRAAGPIRNREMLDRETIGLVLAFNDDLKRSRGTKDMVRQALARGVPVELIDSTGHCEKVEKV